MSIWGGHFLSNHYSNQIKNSIWASCPPPLSMLDFSLSWAPAELVQLAQAGIAAVSSWVQPPCCIRLSPLSTSLPWWSLSLGRKWGNVGYQQKTGSSSFSSRALWPVWPQVLGVRCELQLGRSLKSWNSNQKVVDFPREILFSIAPVGAFSSPVVKTCTSPTPSRGAIDNS